MNVNFEKMIIELDFTDDDGTSVDKLTRSDVCESLAEMFAQMGIICPVSFYCTVNGEEPNPKDYWH